MNARNDPGGTSGRIDPEWAEYSSERHPASASVRAGSPASCHVAPSQGSDLPFTAATTTPSSSPTSTSLMCDGIADGRKPERPSYGMVTRSVSTSAHGPKPVPQMSPTSGTRPERWRMMSAALAAAARVSISRWALAPRRRQAASRPLDTPGRRGDDGRGAPATRNAACP